MHDDDDLPPGWLVFGLTGLDNLTHALFWSLLANVGAYVGVSLWRAPSARETSQALLFVDVFNRKAGARPVFWQGRAKVSALLPLAGRFLGAEQAQRLFADYARRVGASRIATSGGPWPSMADFLLARLPAARKAQRFLLVRSGNSMAPTPRGLELLEPARAA